MTPEEAKARVQSAYQKAIANRSMQMNRSSSLADLFIGVKLYGREAGADFIETHLDRIVGEAVAVAESKGVKLEMPLQGAHGRAAVIGMAEALRALTALEVEETRWGVDLIWAKPNPGLV